MPGDSAFTPSQLTRVTLFGNAILLGTAISFTLLSAPSGPKLAFCNDTWRGEYAPGNAYSNGGLGVLPTYMLSFWIMRRGYSSGRRSKVYGDPNCRY